MADEDRTGTEPPADERADALAHLLRASTALDDALHALRSPPTGGDYATILRAWSAVDSAIESLGGRAP